MTSKIKDIKKINCTSVKNRSPLDKWFLEMIDKTENELTIKDLSHMLRQNIFLDIAVPKAWMILFDSPMIGEMYDGELLKLLIRVLKHEKVYRQSIYYNIFIIDIEEKINLFEWQNNEEKREYVELIEQLKKLCSN